MSENWRVRSLMLDDEIDRLNNWKKREKEKKESAKINSFLEKRQRDIERFNKKEKSKFELEMEEKKRQEYEIYEKKKLEEKKKEMERTRPEREKKIKLIRKKYNLFNKRIIFFINLISIIILYLLLLWESISTAILIQNNFLGVIYKDFNCTNWSNYITNVSPEITKKCKLDKKYIYKYIKGEYFIKDKVSIKYPNLWILNDRNSLDKYYETYHKKYNISDYCKEFIKTETLIHHGFTKYQKYKKVKNNNYENEKKNPLADKYFNRILITRMKLFIKNKKEVERCIPKKYIVDNSVIINRVGTSIGYTHCNVTQNLFNSNIYKGFNSSNQVTYNFGFKVPDVDIIYIISKIIIYPLLYVFVLILIFLLIHIILVKEPPNLNDLDNKDLKQLNYLIKELDSNNPLKYIKMIGITQILSKLVVGFLFYYIDVVNNYICDLEDGKIQCYVNRLTVNTYLGFANLRSQNCYNVDLMNSFGSLHFLELIVNSFLVSSGTLITFLLVFLCHFFQKDFLSFNENFLNKSFIFIQLFHSIFYCIKCCSKNKYICMNILGLFSPLMFLFSLLILMLFNIASIFIFIGNLFSGNWEILFIKLPNFEGLNLDLGMFYNKNIIFLLKIIFYIILIIYDLYLICSVIIKDISNNKPSNVKEQKKELEMINL